MSVIMQSRASFSNWKAVGVDGISAEFSNPYLGEPCSKSKKAFEIGYKGQKTKRTLSSTDWWDRREESVCRIRSS